MPIYLEARNVNDYNGVFGGHMYLVYVPIGEEDNYSAWKTIGAFPEIDSGLGPWGDLDARYIDDVLLGSGSRDEYPRFLESYTQAELDAMDPDVVLQIPTLAEVSEARGRQLIYSGADGIHEENIWNDLAEAANDLDDLYSYKGFTVPGTDVHNYSTVFGAALYSNSFMGSILESTLGLDVNDYLLDDTLYVGVAA